MNIPDEAVRAAQNFLLQRDWRVPYDNVHGAMQAAAQIIAAQVWEEGWNDGVVDDACGCTNEINRTPNPYTEGA